MKKVYLFIFIFIFISIAGYSQTLNIEEKNTPLKINGLNLGDSRKEVINALGNNYMEELIEDESGYIGEDFYFWNYDNGNKVMIGKNSKKLLGITINNSNIKTSLGFKVGDKAKDVLERYRNKYDELVSIHTDEPVTGWFMVSKNIVLIFDFEEGDYSRVNDNINSNDKVKTIQLAYIKHFD